jgi:hypothetical protein
LRENKFLVQSKKFFLKKKIFLFQTTILLSRVGQRNGERALSRLSPFPHHPFYQVIYGRGRKLGCPQITSIPLPPFPIHPCPSVFVRG